ncbi:MAG: nickel-dependent hydrogenase large subunit [Paracoccaceae bacterium]
MRGWYDEPHRQYPRGATSRPTTTRCGIRRPGFRRKRRARATWRQRSRGALGHWIVIEDRKIANYQAVVLTTWNAGPRDATGASGPYEAALKGHSLAVPEQPLEILRTIHSSTLASPVRCTWSARTAEETMQIKVSQPPMGRTGRAAAGAARRVSGPVLGRARFPWAKVWHGRPAKPCR